MQNAFVGLGLWLNMCVPKARMISLRIDGFNARFCTSSDGIRGWPIIRNTKTRLWARGWWGKRQWIIRINPRKRARITWSRWWRNSEKRIVWKWRFRSGWGKYYSVMFRGHRWSRIIDNWRICWVLCPSIKNVVNYYTSPSLDTTQYGTPSKRTHYILSLNPVSLFRGNFKPTAWTV